MIGASIKLALAFVALAPLEAVWSKEVHLGAHEEEYQNRKLRRQPRKKDRTLQGQTQIGTRSTNRNGSGGGGGSYYGNRGGGGGGGGGQQKHKGAKSTKGGGGGGGGGGGHMMSGGGMHGGGHPNGGGGMYYESGGGGGGGMNGGGGGHSRDEYYGSGGGGGGGHNGGGGGYYGGGGGMSGGGGHDPYSDDNYHDDYFMWDSPNDPNDPYSDDNWHDDYFMWGNGPPSGKDPYSDDNWHDDYFMWGDDTWGKQPTYDDYFYYPELDDYVPGHDDFFVGTDDYYYKPPGGGGGGKGRGKGGGKGGGKRGKNAKSGKSSKYCKKVKKEKNGKNARKQYYYECEDDDNYPGYDDYWIPYDDHVTDDLHLDDTYFFYPRPVATIWGEAFSPQTSVPAVPPNPLVPETTDLGTTYLYTNWTTNVQDIDMFEIPVYVDGEEVIIWISLDGYCTRFGTPDNSVQGYCHFTYTVYDPESLLISGSFAAEGFLVDETQPGEFTILGGTGILTGASGIVEISPAALDSAMNPPLVVSPPVGSDIFDGVAGYVHYFEVQADLFFFMPDLYYTGNGGSGDGYYR